MACGAKGPPPNLSHSQKYKLWLFSEGNNPETDSLQLIGNLIEEFMDSEPGAIGYADDPALYETKKSQLVRQLEASGLRYFRGGRVFPEGNSPASPYQPQFESTSDTTSKPASVQQLIELIIKMLPRAIYPLAYRRKGLTPLSFDSEYDVQDLLHSQLRPWIMDIRPEEVTPSYAGSSTRIDFVLRTYRLAIEVKRVRDVHHGKKLKEELIIDFEHYVNHKDCDTLWCVIYDPNRNLQNPEGFKADLEGARQFPTGSLEVRLFVI